MTDQQSPTNQFHPYSAPTATPHREMPETGLQGLLNKMGLSNSPAVARARDYARANPGAVLGGLAALVISAGLMSRRGTSRSFPEGKRRTFPKR